MAPVHRAALRPFTPSREAPEALIARTVGRDDLLAAIHGRLRAAGTSGNRSHTLTVGARGSGKTHVLDVALHRLQIDEELSSRLLVGRIDEDVVGIVTYADLVLQLLASLRPPAAVLDTARTGRDVAAVEAAIIGHLGDRVLVVVLENLAKVFDALGSPGQRNLRSFVETSGRVVLLASTPLLFQALGSRNEPWFGSFAIEHLPELTLEEGIEVVRRLAAQDGDERFVAFLGSPKGRGRLAALHHLAGGSPRLWMILAGCATVELLDDLVPAVETLLENLVAYYQQRLWDLPGNEQKLVRELGTGPPSASVGELAALCGLDERTAATALGRLVESGWVRREKLAGADQRKSWYRLREPLLRHHFQYRHAHGEPLRLIVDILRTWFDPMERRAHLAVARPTSVAERYLLATLSLDPPQGPDASYADRDVDRLLAEARFWMVDPEGIGSRDVGILLEAALMALYTTPEEVRHVLADRQASPSVLRRAEQLLAVLETLPADWPPQDRAGPMLDAAASVSAADPDHCVLELLATCWNGAADPANAVERLGSLGDMRCSDRLTLAIRHELGSWLAKAGRYQEAAATAAAMVEDRIHLLGPDDPDTLASRQSLCVWLGLAGRNDEAIEAVTALLNDQLRVLGPDHRDTLASRQGLTIWLGVAGRYDESVAATGSLLNDQVRVLGPDHPDTLATRHNLATRLGQIGRHTDAVTTCSSVVDDHYRVFGPDHLATLYSRHNLACLLSKAGRHDEAVVALIISTEDFARVLGPDHMHTHTARYDLALGLGDAGRHDEAIVALTALMTDGSRVLGLGHPDTLRVRYALAYELAQAGRHDEALAVAFSAFDDEMTGKTEPSDVAFEGAAALGSILIEFVRDGRPLPPVERLGIFASSTQFALLQDMEAARNGSAEAAARLPAELRSLAEGPIPVQ